MSKQADQHPLRQQAWDYFALHAAQRLTTFNFYLVVAGAITAGMVTSLGRDVHVPLLGVVLGLLLIFISFVFRKLDKRNRYLIKNAEAALRTFETALESVKGDDEGAARVFTREEADSGDDQYFTYTRCFLLVFWTFGVIGFVGAVLSIVLSVASLKVITDENGNTFQCVQMSNSK